MNEQGPTREHVDLPTSPEMEQAILAARRLTNMALGYGDIRAIRLAQHVATANALRARHIREAVEGMPSINAPEADFVCVEWMSERGYPFRVTMPRAALLAALTKGNE